MQRRLLVDGQPAALGARAFDLLLALIERRGNVVSKKDLLDVVWSGLVVEENNLTVQISALRKLLGASAITTIPGRGYRFTAALDGKDEVRPPLEVPASTPVFASLAQPASNLPYELPRLIGRAHDLAEVQRMVRCHRLVTVTGAGGIGKTKLARAVAHSMRGDYADGVWAVELASVLDPGNVFAAVAQTLGVSLSSTQPPQQVLAELLARQRLHLLLDNCEHVLDSVATLTEALLASAPDVKLLVSSQEPLKLSQERQHRLDPLSVPNEDDDLEQALECGAIALFIERAQVVDPRFALSKSNLAVVIDICRRLDGIPLAIELAAARVSLLGARGLRDRLGERFRLLTAGSRVAPARHQTLLAALDWSHGLLSAAEQIVFRRLGVFFGGWTLEAAQQAASDDEIDAWEVLEHLGALVDKSIVVVQGGDAPRYMLLETARAYALDKLAQAGETEQFVQRHAQVTLALFERAEEERFGEQGALSSDAYFDRVQPEIDNLRAALTWASRPGGEESTLIALVAASASAFDKVGLAAEGVAMLRTLMPRVPLDLDSVSTARFWLAVALFADEGRMEDGAFGQALALAEEGCRRHRWQRRLYLTLVDKAWNLILRQEFAAAEAALTEAISIERPNWPGWLRSSRWNTLSFLQGQTGAFELAQASLEQIARMLPRNGEDGLWCRQILNAAADCNRREEWDHSVALLEPMIDRALQQRRNVGMAAWACGTLVHALTQLGRLDDAAARMKQALPLWRANGFLHAWSFVAIGLAVAQGRFADAVRLMGAEEATGDRALRHAPIVAKAWANSQRLIEAAEPDPLQREIWRREGEALDQASILALYQGDSDAAAQASRG